MLLPCSIMGRSAVILAGHSSEEASPEVTSVSGGMIFARWMLHCCNRSSGVLNLVLGEQHHSDQLQTMPVRKMPGSGYEAGTGGRHSQAQAGVTNPPNKRKLLSFQGNCFPWCDCISYQEERRRQEMVELQQEMGIQVIKDGFIPHKQFDKKQKTASFLVNNLTPKVSNHQQQQRQQPRNGVQQLLQAQQASLYQYSNHKNNMMFTDTRCWQQCKASSTLTPLSTLWLLQSRVTALTRLFSIRYYLYFS